MVERWVLNVSPVIVLSRIGQEHLLRVKALMQRGISRHEAIHRVGTILVDEIYYILKDDRPFDEPGFVRKLGHLLEQ